MAQFRFRLATLRRLKEADRDQRRLELAEAMAAGEAIARRIAAIDRGLNAIADARLARPGPVDVAALDAAHRYAAQLRAERGREAEAHAVAAEEVARRREGLLAADREVRALAKLRDKQLARFNVDQQRREQQALDEAGRTAIAREGVWRRVGA